MYFGIVVEGILWSLSNNKFNVFKRGNAFLYDGFQLEVLIVMK